MAKSEQGSSMIDVEDLVKARILEALLAGSKVVVNKASNSTSSESNGFFFVFVFNLKKTNPFSFYLHWIFLSVYLIHSLYKIKLQVQRRKNIRAE